MAMSEYASVVVRGCFYGVEKLSGGNAHGAASGSSPGSGTDVSGSTTTVQSDPSSIYLPDDWSHDPESFSHTVPVPGAIHLF